MTRPNITPGPWYAMPMHQTEETIIFADNAEPQVAVVRWKCGVEDNRELANIKAITAVPALLEALEFCHKFASFREQKGEPLPIQLTSSIRSALIAAGYQF